MSDPYRDDLEAALQRAEKLARDNAQLEQDNRLLEAQLAQPTRPAPVPRAARPLSPRFMRGLGIAGLILLACSVVTGIVFQALGDAETGAILIFVVPLCGSLAVLFAVGLLKLMRASDRLGL